ncbi:BT1A1 protein, partial [Todus mexicanus]|nr:BT1A1 protein [Todus mexicanus]
KVTLDPSTAHPQLLVAPDGGSVRWEEAQEVPAAEEVQGGDPCVLARQGFTSGSFYWEVEVASKGSWAVGVAKESLKKKKKKKEEEEEEEEEGEEAPGSPKVELWSMGVCEGQFWALTSLERVQLQQLQVPRKVRVSLDYEKGQVAFFDAERRTLIFAFPRVSFQGEKVHP